MTMNDNDLPPEAPADTIDFAELGTRMRGLWRFKAALAGALVAGSALGLGISYAFTPTYVSSALFIPPQQQSGAAGALASLGALSSLVGGASAKSSVDEYISMMLSVTVSDRVIKRFSLDKVYATEFKDETRKRLSKRVTVTAGKKDGLIRVEVEDTDPKRAAAMANDYVDELREMTSHLAVTEAQQRRVFFERMLGDTKQKLVTAQVALEASGFTQGALKVEPRSAAETYAKLRADLTANQVQLQVMRGSLAETSPQVVRQLNTVQALSDQVAHLEASQAADQGSPDYIGKYRDFKYQETLFDLYAKQFELARIDESREGALIQVVDEGQPAEHKHFPRRILFAALGGVIAFLLVAGFAWRRTDSDVEPSARI
jgi:uncharacterized protein involved in exopolysaccharide biosynthesis